jgi:hypothetical protein
MNRLNVGERFSLPIDFVTETQAILAMRRVETRTFSVCARRATSTLATIRSRLQTRELKRSDPITSPFR